jgi:phage terminase small subunit
MTIAKTVKTSWKSSEARRKRFVEEYSVDCNGTQAAVRAGYSVKTAAVQASRLLRNAKLRGAIDLLLAQNADRAALTAGEVITGIRRTIRRCEALGSDFQPFAALKGYELLGKHLKMWTNDKETTDDSAIVARLLEGRKRVAEMH